MRRGARSLFRYLGHLAIAWPGVTAVIFGGAVFWGVISQLAHVSTAWPAIDALVDVPFFPLELAAALALGFCRNRRGQRAPCWVWLPALAFFVWDAHGVLVQPFDGGWRSVWNTYFGYGCQSSECLGEVLVTAPLYTSIVYSLGALAARLRARARRA